jgi:hypothetical protein
VERQLDFNFWVNFWGAIITWVLFTITGLLIVFQLSLIIQDKTDRSNDIAKSLQTALVPVWLGLATDNTNIENFQQDGDLVKF